MSYAIDPATADDIVWIGKFEAEMYSAEDAVPHFRLMEWFTHNPNGFSIIKHDQRPIGHIDLLPLKSRPLQEFMSGRIVERDICGADLYSAAERDSITSLYVESLAIYPSNGHSRPLAVGHLLTTFPTLISRIAEATRLETLYAMAATTAGQRFLSRLGFDLAAAKKTRKDNHDFYSIKADELYRHLSAQTVFQKSSET